MNKLTLTLGQTPTALKKSNRYIGVKFSSKMKQLPVLLRGKKPIHQRLANFVIYNVGNSYKKVEAFLNKIRKHKNVILATHVYYDSLGKTPIVPNGYIRITFTVNSKKKNRHLLLKKLSLKKHKVKGDHQVVVYTTKDSVNPFKASHLLEASDIVAQAEPDFDIPLSDYEVSLPTSPIFPLLWHLENNGTHPIWGNLFKSGADMRVVKAWNRLGNKGSDKIRIAVIDRGFQFDHPTIIDRIKDKVTVYEAPFKWKQTLTGHGTPCASLAVASESSKGMIGVAPNSQLFIIEGPSFSIEDNEEMAKYCIDNDIDIVSCSWGDVFRRISITYHEEAWKEYFEKGRKGKGGIVLFASGNEGVGEVNVFGKMEGVMCIGGTNSRDDYYSVSNRGKEVFVSAPAGETSLVAAKTNYVLEKSHHEMSIIPGNHEGDYYHFGGTSAATPLVAGVCALILSANPILTGEEVKDILKRTADKVGDKPYDSKGHSKYFGYGRINADNAVKEALRMKDPSSHLPDLNEAGGNGLYHFQVKPMSSKGWGIQTGSLNNYGNVLRMVDKLQKKFGNRVLIHIHELNGVPSYRVILGPFDTNKKAKTFQKKVKEVGIESFVKKLNKLK